MKKYLLKKGILISIEGVDGAGKTTQSYRLKDYFKRKGFDTIYLKEPTNGCYGQKIRNLAINGRHLVSHEEELELFIQDRIEDCRDNIKPALNDCKIIFMDRYYHSNIAYQGALGIDIKHIKERNEKIAVIPDLVIIMDVAVKIGLSRITNFRNEQHNHFEKEEYLEKVRQIFCKLKDPNIQLIDASREEDDVFKHLKNITTDIIMPHTYVQEDQFDLFVNSIQKKSVHDNEIGIFTN